MHGARMLRTRFRKHPLTVPCTFMGALGGVFRSRGDLAKVPGAYRRRIAPKFKILGWTKLPENEQRSRPSQNCGGGESSADVAWEMEKAQLVHTILAREGDILLRIHPLPYQWMTIIVGARTSRTGTMLSQVWKRRQTLKIFYLCVLLLFIYVCVLMGACSTGDTSPFCFSNVMACKVCHVSAISMRSCA